VQPRYHTGFPAIDPPTEVAASDAMRNPSCTGVYRPENAGETARPAARLDERRLPSAVATEIWRRLA